MWTVADVMTRNVVTLKPSDDLGQAADLLKLAHIRHLPVVEDGKLVGLVTHRDLIKVLAGLGEFSRRSKTAAEVMTRELTRVLPSTPLRKALRLMLDHKFGCLPVVEQRGSDTLVGIITEADLVRFASEFVTDLDRIERTARTLAAR